jgi:hypothetical protein
MSNRIVRIANGQGFWGDSIEAPVQLVEGGGIDYLTLDYLAEVTMSIMQRQKEKNPEAGYARDFVELIDRILPQLMEKNIKVIANAGGVNSPAAAKALLKVAEKHNISGLKIGIIVGDDILYSIDDLQAKGATFANMENGENFSDIKDKVKSANVYIGAEPIAKALDMGAHIVLAGRVTDPALALGPMIHEFGWKMDDFHRLAMGTLAGHITECGAQCTGGNYSRWWDIKDYAGIGYPVIEIEESGEFVITKQKGTGGIVNLMSISEQLLYEMGDPNNYISPDVVVDFTGVKIKEDGENRVKAMDVNGIEPTEFYKVSLSYFAGYKASGQLTVSGPRALDKAKLVAEIIWERLKRAGYSFEETSTEFLGVSPCDMEHPPKEFEVNGIVLRLGVRDEDRDKVVRFSKEIAPVITSGPPGITGFAGGRPKPQEIIAYWPALIPKTLIKTSVHIVEEK